MVIPGQFPGEPLGACDAIVWHTQQKEYHDNQASMADACDVPESAAYHEQKWKAHRARLRLLKAEFPETAKHAEMILEAMYRDDDSKLGS